MVAKQPIRIRVGEGHDSHRTVSDRPLMLGGQQIDCDFGLDGHSDADVLLHAVIDSLLGAIAAGDIGDWFPNTEAKWENASSAKMAKHVVKSVRKKGWEIGNLDCTIFAEKPRLTDWKPRIRERLADVLGIDEQCVNVKAKSGEKVGPVGRCEAIAASSVVLLFSRTD